MIFLNAFLLGGALCLLTQFLFRISGRSVIFILTFTLCVGILVTALGWMDLFTGFGQAGMFLLLYGAGEAAYLGMAGLLAGDPVPLCAVWGCCCVALPSALAAGCSCTGGTGAPKKTARKYNYNSIEAIRDQLS